ncbi:MAG TPA: Stf0 family sulfotransferase [Solirubrobacteraceae bacterium]|nr:Stf0 family sulfotransferase [Solirubrobacteraceae bacterium]
MTPTRSYLVCATPRSGSTLLCRLLDQTGVAGRPEEYFEALRHSGIPRRPEEYFDRERHANIIQRLAFREMPSAQAKATPNPLWSTKTYDEYLAWALEQGTTPNGVFGAKLMWGYLGDFAQLLRGIDGLASLPVPELLTRVFPGLRYVQITREDKVRQAVSLWKAVQTQAWRREGGDGATPATEPTFSFRAINYLVRLLTAHDASWDAYFLGLGHDPLKITYEELAAAPSTVVAQVLTHLDIAVPDGFRLDDPQLEVQADAISEDWVRRVHEHLAALETPDA